MITKDNVLLLEKAENVNTEIMDIDGKVVSLKGMSIHRVIESKDGNFKELVTPDPSKENIDISGILDKEGYYLASVDINQYGAFVWTCVKLGEAIRNMDKDDLDYNIITFSEDIRECTEEEVIILNELFPEYYENCYK